MGGGYKLRDFNHWNSLNFIALSGISLLVDKIHLRNMAFLSFKGSKVFSEGFKLMWLDTAICSLNTLLHSFVGITQSVIFTRIFITVGRQVFHIVLRKSNLEPLEHILFSTLQEPNPNKSGRAALFWVLAGYKNA